MQAALSGANPAVVGVLLAALYNLVWTEGGKTAPDAATAVAGGGVCRRRRAMAALSGRSPRPWNHPSPHRPPLF